MTTKQQQAWDAAIEALEVCALEVINHPDGHTRQFANAQEMAEAAIWLLREAGDGWEPIETAPLDGTPVDLWTHNGRYADATFKDGRWVFQGVNAWGTYGNVPVVYAPTHYLPLPAPPKPL